VNAGGEGAGVRGLRERRAGRATERPCRTGDVLPCHRGCEANGEERHIFPQTPAGEEMKRNDEVARLREEVSGNGLLKPGEGPELGMTLDQYLVYHQTIHLKDCSWMGVLTVKNPMDMWIYQEIIWEVKPDVIVEIGTYVGGSTLYLAQVLDGLDKGIVVAIRQ